METFQTSSPQQTQALGRQLARRLRRGDCVALIGGLGAGKTILARGLAIGLGLADQRLASSPTYVLVQEYPADVPVYHIDLYRMGDAPAELAALGLEEMLADGVVLIEWADRAAGALPQRRWEIRIDIVSARRRRLSLRRLPEGARPQKA